MTTPAVLVTGGTGVVGRPLVRGLVAAGHRVIALSRQIMPPDPGAARVEYLRGDVSQPRLGLSAADYRALCHSVGQVFHLAARTDFKGAGVAAYQSVNINGVKNVHALARAAGAHLHHVSTAFVCGSHAGLFSEDDLECGQQFRNGYEESKFRAECWLRERLAAGDPAITIYRPGIILERRPSRDSVNTFGPFIFLDAVFRLLLTRAMAGPDAAPLRIMGQRAAHLPFIFDDDVATALLRLAQRPDAAGRTFHLVCATPCANSVLEDVFNQAFGRRVAALVPPRAFAAPAPSQPERILARKTAMYAPYLDLGVLFDRRRLVGVMGEDFCSSVRPEELLEAFGHFLACKKKDRDSPGLAGRQRLDIEAYFEHFLPAIIGQQLLANLASLTCTFWLEVAGLPRRTLVIDRGRLASISAQGTAAFGYRVQPEIFLAVVGGRLSPQRGFFDGNIALEGNTMEALRTATALEEFFQSRPYLLS